MEGNLVETQAQMLNLDALERVVRWQNEKGETRGHIFRRVTLKDWDGYFDKIAVETEGENRLIDVSSAALWLYERCAIRAEGYLVKEGAPVTSIPNWQRRIPPGHRVVAVAKLLEVRTSPGVREIEPDVETVSLEALWNADGCGDGKMVKFSGLIHRFRPPMAEHESKFSREIGRARIVGGSRTGRTIYPARQKVLVALYDDLIQSVDGYSSGGAALEGRDRIVAEMDAVHKAVAAAQLFSFASDEARPSEGSGN